MGREIDYLVGWWLAGDSRGEFLIRFLGESSESSIVYLMSRLYSIRRQAGEIIR